MSAGRFLWSVFVASDAPTHGQLVIVPITLAKCPRRPRVVSSSASREEEARSSALRVSNTLDRRLAGDPGVDQHRDREVFHVEAISGCERLVLEVELPPVLLTLEPCIQKGLDIANPPVELACSVDRVQASPCPGSRPGGSDSHNAGG